MKHYLYCLIALFCISCASCNNDNRIEPQEPASDRERALIDSQATEMTKALYRNLFEVAQKGTMFGAQIPTLYGLDGGQEKWYAKPGETDKSDIKYLTGSHPAVCGWELSNIELDMELNIDNEDFDEIRKHIIAAFERGAVNTISWHCANPVSGGNSWDGTRAVYSIIPGGANHEKFKVWLDRLANFMLGLKSGGELIPIIFRPWHEHTGAGFWWGKGNCSKTEFIELWKFTVEYLRDTKGLHNLIWAYSPDMIHLYNGREEYLEYWPGDDWVDMLGLDAYDRDGADYGHRGLQLVRMTMTIAKEKNKPFAITETGLENNDPKWASFTNKKWWTGNLYKVIANQPVSFALVWRNGDFPDNGGHFFSAYRGCYTADDFVAFSQKPWIIMENNLPDMYK